jgi:hypothetical protein
MGAYDDNVFLLVRHTGIARGDTAQNGIQQSCHGETTNGASSKYALSTLYCGTMDGTATAQFMGCDCGFRRRPGLT